MPAKVEIEKQILLIREQRVMLDSDLAQLYGVKTEALNQAVKRNRNRFPSDFLFRLTLREKKEVITNCDHLQNLKFSPSLPNAFTEHGAVMLANVLRSPRAIQASVQVVRAFIQLRSMLAEHRELARRLDLLERRYDERFKAVFEAIRRLMAPPPGGGRRIGFHGG
ncbi:MAG: hypothetical protein COV76_06935 [Candidatus Omnitrophica bacterium CG11_big_fil_rev_8_21_14_0_20_64_10]|nr:MAG: hypothetical protein COV76_06935 [Candidatus Omnitrophica bacterium CG11_big_fil_rev_8_21_14_0_20_64_10]